MLGALGLLLAAPAHAQLATPDAAVAVPGSLWSLLFREVRLTPGPLRWSGDLSSEIRLQQFAGQPGQRAFVEGANVAVATYLHQPWFAQAAANLGLVWTSVGGASTGRSTSLTGGAHLSLFPMSRFPLEANLDVTDSRTSEEAAGAAYRNVLVGLRQSWRLADDTLLTARLDRSEIRGESLGRDVLGVASGSLSGRRGAQGFSADGFWSTNDGGSSGTENRIRRLNGSHTYVPAENLTVDSLATYNDQEVRQKGSLARGTLAGRFAQLTSYATWRPDEDSPLHDPKHALLVTGGVRLTAIGLDVEGASSNALGLNLSGGVSYDLGPNTRFAGSGSVTESSAGAGQGGLFTNFNATVSYDPPPLRWGPTAYSWRLAGGASSGTGGEADRQALTGQFNHQVTRDFPVLERSVLTLTLGQGLSGNVNTRHEDVAGVSVNAQATFSMQGESGSQTYASLGISDVRAFGNPENAFQLVNLQLTRQAPVDALSSFSANLTVQGARQQGEPGVFTTARLDTGFNVTTYGSVSYNHRRAFGVPRLRFTATYTANASQLQSRAEGDLKAPPQVIGDTFDARLEYRVGKLEARLLARSTTVDGRRSAGLYFRATRHF